MNKIERYMSYAVSQERMMHDLTEICKWERLSGTAEELKAFQYVEKQMQEAGAETELIFHDAYISLPISGKLMIAGKEYICHTASMAKSTPPEGVKGTLVYLEDGVQHITGQGCSFERRRYL